MEVFIGRVPPGVGVPEISDLFASASSPALPLLVCPTLFSGRFADFDNLAYAERAIAELNGYQMGQQGTGLNVKPATAKVPRSPMPEPARPIGLGMQGLAPSHSSLGAAHNIQGIAGGSQVSSPFAARQETPQMQPQVFIGRLPVNCEQRELEEMFGPYGAHSIKLLEGKNCAFATFDTWAAAERAIAELDKTPMRADGNPEGINVKLADVKGAPKGSQQEPKVFIGGLAPIVTDEDVRRVCQQFGTITHSKIFTKNDKAMPCAFVTFSSFTEAEVCINAMSGKGDLAAEGKTLVVKMADLAKSRSTPQPPVPQMQAFAPAPMPMRAVPPPTMRAAAPLQPYSQYQQNSFQQQTFQPTHQSMTFAGQAAPMGKAKGGDDPVPTSMGGGQGEKVFVGGLPEAVTMEFVWGMMAPFGQVADVKILRKQGASPCGFVRFAQLEDAELAVEALQSCRFTVKFADSKPTQKRSFDEAFRPF